MGRCRQPAVETGKYTVRQIPFLHQPIPPGNETGIQQRNEFRRENYLRLPDTQKENGMERTLSALQQGTRKGDSQRKRQQRRPEFHPYQHPERLRAGSLSGSFEPTFIGHAALQLPFPAKTEYVHYRRLRHKQTEIRLFRRLHGRARSQYTSTRTVCKQSAYPLPESERRKEMGERNGSCRQQKFYED